MTVTSTLTDGSHSSSVLVSPGAGGSVVLAPDPTNFPLGNTYTGGTTINGGTVQFGSPRIAGYRHANGQRRNGKSGRI